MANLLHIVASPRDDSYSTRLAAAFLDTYRQSAPEDRIETLDLFRAEIPPFCAPAAKAKYALIAGQAAHDEAERAWQPVLEAINHFKRFDKYLLSSPMWNFGIPYRLKQYIDVIVQPALTFGHSPEKGYSGLVTGRPLMLLLARGGVYSSGNPLETFDFQESYLRAIFGFIGFTDIRTAAIQGTLQNKPEQIETDMRTAIAEVRDAAHEFAGEMAVQV
jgi:FMN-dependent NADH-azoreductase